MGEERQEGEMELNEREWQASEGYLEAFEALIGDERTGRTVRAIVHGVIAGESLRASRIARFSP